MKDSLPLTPLELGYKRLFVSGQPIDQITDKESFFAYFSQFGQVDESFYQEHLNFVRHTPIREEDSAIKDGDDIFITRYPRYLPPYTHSHKWIELYYVAQESVAQVVDHNQIELHAGDLLIMSPGVQHSFSIMNDNGLAYLVCIRQSTFSAAFTPLLNTNDPLSDFFLQTIYDNLDTVPYMLFKTGRDPLIESALQAMLAEYGSSLPLTGMLVDLSFELICVELIRKHKNSLFLEDISQYSGKGNVIDITRILYYILNNYQSVTLSEMADHFNYSEAHLCRIIKNTTGKTFAGIRTAIKVQHAAYMLQNSPAMSISAICKTVGYADCSAFYKAFKHETGYPPAEYRKLKATTSE